MGALAKKKHYTHYEIDFGRRLAAKSRFNPRKSWKRAILSPWWPGRRTGASCQERVGSVVKSVVRWRAMTSRPQPVWSREEFLDLLDDGDLEALWQRWDLPSTEPRIRQAPSFKAALAARSDTTLVHEVLALRTRTLQMLRDVVGFLDTQSAAARTTGSHLVLREEFDITPQQVAAALRWSQAVLRRYSAATWDQLRSRFDSEIIPLFRKIDAYGAVETRRRQEDIYKAAMRAQLGGSSVIRRILTVRYHRERLRTREEYIQKLAELNKSLEPLLGRDVPDIAKQLLRSLVDFYRRRAAQLRNDKDDIRRADRSSTATSGITALTDEEHETWNKFAESILFLSDVEESTEAVDLLRMDLFRKRPQLYEVWIVVVIIRFMQRCGHNVELLSLHTTGSGRTVWNLNYTKSDTAIARFVHRRTGTALFLFYQLYRQGKRGNMPDLALMPSGRANDIPLWIMDPKHSERGGYSLTDYKEVAARYQTEFAPRFTWIVEYYQRPELGVANPLALVEHADLLRDVAPGAEGYRHLLERLRTFHGVSDATIAIIDVSGSFLENFSRVKADLKELYSGSTVLADDVIWFSDEAVYSSGCLDAIEAGTLEPPQRLAGRGTRFGPVQRLLEQFRGADWAFNALRLYTDGGFDDVSLNDARTSLQALADVAVIDFNP
jgi:hypothetical protein